MSLVNDMLQDLNRRHRGSDQTARINTVFAPRRQAEPVRGDATNVVILAVVSIALGLGAGFLMFRETQQAVPLAATKLPAEPAAVSATSATNLANDIITADVAADVLTPMENFLPALVNAGNTITIVEESVVTGGFTLRITADKPLPFTTLHRTDTTFAVRLEQVSGIASQQVSARGISLLQSDGGIVVEYSADTDTDFQLYEDATTPAFDLVLNGKQRHIDSGHKTAHEVADATGQTDDWYAAGSAYMPQSRQPGSLPLPKAVPEYWRQPEVPKSSPQTAPVRTTRELPLEKRDARNSQQAIALVQSGQLFDAYQNLIDFISVNPDAHLSRETLATVLVAQNEYAQAEAVINEGLLQVPHYAAFKKIKARLLMLQENPEAALTLLRNLPPRVEEDAEYFELLAMLYQQTGDNTLALATYQSLLRIDGTQGRWWAGMGISLEGLQRNADALASYQAASQAPGLDAGLHQFTLNKIKTLSTQQ